MIFYYGWIPGLVANGALILNVLFIMGILASFKAVLTMPGIAGIVLTLGMAVDANVIIFERIKEELNAGQSLVKGIESGFKKGFSAIFDGNLTTLIITAILFQFGTGPIKGFAITLTIGTLASMFTALTVTRLLLKITAVNLKVTNIKLYGAKEAK
jgi:protein-export membrane protein SecD